MYYRFIFVIVTITAIVGVTLPGCDGNKCETNVSKGGCSENSTAKKTPSLSPLVVNKAAPLLLDEPSENKKSCNSSAASGADNSQCFVCHANYKTEELATQHAAINYGCVDCHGESTAHCNDEFHLTPPDIMYTKDQIDELCLTCHETHDMSAEKLAETWQQHHPNEAVPKIIACTDCHGEHLLKSRIVRWDKKTRKLIPSK